MTPLGREAEQKLINSAESAVAQAVTGQDPDQVLAKFAADNGYNADMTERLVNLFNTKRTLAHYASTSVGKERAASIPLAKYASVLELSGVQVKKKAFVSATSQEIRSGIDFMAIDKAEQVWHKAASEAAPVEEELDIRPLVKKAECELRFCKSNLSDLKVELRECEQRQEAAIAQLSTYFKRASVMPFSQFEQTVRFTHGKAGQLVADLAAAELSFGKKASYEQIKRADEGKITRELPDMGAEPWCYVDKIIDRVQATARKSASVEEARTQVKAAQDVVDRAEAHLLKEAAVPYAANMLGGSLIERVLPASASGSLRDATDKIKTYNVLNAAQLNSKLQSIRAESLLSDLSTTDPVLNKYNQTELADAYNDMLKTSPDAANDPATVRTFLRQYLESSADPASRMFNVYDLQGLLDVNKQLAGKQDFLRTIVGENKK